MVEIVYLWFYFLLLYQVQNNNWTIWNEQHFILLFLDYETSCADQCHDLHQVSRIPHRRTYTPLFKNEN